MGTREILARDIGPSLSVRVYQINDLVHPLDPDFEVRVYRDGVYDNKNETYTTDDLDVARSKMIEKEQELRRKMTRRNPTRSTRGASCRSPSQSGGGMSGGGMSAKQIAESIARSKREILEDIKKGIVPASVSEFSALHDYVDANEYGGLCEEKYPWDIPSVEIIQNAVNDWLRAGRPSSRASSKARKNPTKKPTTKKNPAPRSKAKKPARKSRGKFKVHEIINGYVVTGYAIRAKGDSFEVFSSHKAHASAVAAILNKPNGKAKFVAYQMTDSRDNKHSAKRSVAAKKRNATKPARKPPFQVELKSGSHRFATKAIAIAFAKKHDAMGHSSRVAGPKGPIAMFSGSAGRRRKSAGSAGKKKPDAARSVASARTYNLHLEFHGRTAKGGASDKVWIVAVKGSKMMVRFGKIGRAPREIVKTFGSNAEAVRAASKLADEKTAKGYRVA